MERSRPRWGVAGRDSGAGHRGVGQRERGDSGRVLVVLRLVVFVDLLGLTLVLPILPFQTLQLGGSGLWLGVVLAGYSAAQAVAAPVLGRLADRYGRRRLLLVSLAGSTMSLALMGLAPSLWLLLAARVVAGVCGGSIGVAHALAADLTPAHQRSRVMGQLGMSIGAAFTIGPLLGAVGADAGFTVVAMLGAALAAAAWLLACRLLPGRTAVVASGGAPTPGAEGSWRLPYVLLAAGFAGMCALVGMEATVAFLAEHRFAAGPGFVGVLLFVAGLTMTLVQARPLAVAVRRWGDRRVGVVGAVLMAVSLVVLPLSSAPVFVAAVAVVAAGHGLLTTTTTSLLSQVAPPGRRGALLGRGQSAAAAGRLIGPVAAGALYDLGPGLPYAAGAVFAAVAAVAVGTGRRGRSSGATMATDQPSRPRGEV